MQAFMRVKQDTSNIPVFVYTSAVARKKVFRAGQDDIRAYPCYSIQEAAYYLGLSQATLRSWVVGRWYQTKTGPKRFEPLIKPANPRHLLLSFYNIAEAHVLAATRERNVPVRKIRIAVEHLRTFIDSPHPLISYDFATFGKDIFLQQIGKPPENLSGPPGQFGIKQILKKYLKRIERGVDGMPVELFPVRHGITTKTKPVVINPNVSSGKPVIKGTRITAEVVWSRKKAGESIKSLAHDFRLKPSEIKAAINYFAPAA